MTGGSGPRASEEARRVVERLVEDGRPEAEVFAKEGRSRRFERSASGRLSAFHREAGWAARAGDDRGSFAFAATGRPEPRDDWPAPDGRGLALPEPPARPAAWREPPEVEAPLLSEREGFALLDALSEALRAELPGARLLTAVLEDGASTSEIVSSRGADARWRSRAAWLHAAAIGPGAAGTARATIERVVGDAHRIEPRAVARRLADRLSVAGRGRPPGRDRGEMLLAPTVGAALLAGLMPLWVGAEAAAHRRRLEDRSGRLASAELTLIDDGRLAGGVLAAPADGEGMPTRAVTLIDEGSAVRSLVSWSRLRQEGRGGGETGAGSARRPGWRDLPRPGPSHLYAAPDPGRAVSDLLAGVARGYYLIEASGPPRIDLEDGRLALPVAGFTLARGRPAAPIAGARLTGTVGAFLRGIAARGRDLDFLPAAGGLVGAPTLLVQGMGLE